MLGVGALILDNKSRLLLVKRLEQPDSRFWSLPGGKIEDFETPQEGLLRELKEELGVDATIESYLGKTIYADRISLAFKVNINSTPVNNEPYKHERINFFEISEVEKINTTKPVKFALSKLNTIQHRLTKHSVAKAADVILIQPFFPLADDEASSIPLGLSSISAYLRQNNYKTACYDCTIDKDYSAFLRDMVHFDNKVIGLQFHSDMSHEWCLTQLKYLRKIVPNAFIVAGGEAGSNKKESILKSGANAVVIGEGEISFFDLCNHFYKKTTSSLQSIEGIAYVESNSIVVNRDRQYVEDLDTLPYHDIDSFSWDAYGQWTLMTSRGCPFKCIYCSSATYWKSTIRYYSAERVFYEIKRLYDLYDVRKLYIADDVFTSDRQRAKKILKLIIDSYIKIEWSCLTRVELFDEHLLSLMRDSGCVQISFGVESVNKETQKLIAKNSSKGNIENAIAKCKYFGIRSRVSVILGLPNESFDDCINTMNFLIDLEPNEVQLYALTPHDGTALYNNLDEYGVKVINNKSSSWTRDVLHPTCETNLLTLSEIRKLGRLYVEQFTKAGYTYLDPSMDIKKINAEKTIATSFSPIQSLKR